jgi:hypothetical protein
MICAFWTLILNAMDDRAPDTYKKISDSIDGEDPGLDEIKEHLHRLGRDDRLSPRFEGLNINAEPPVPMTFADFRDHLEEPLRKLWIRVVARDKLDTDNPNTIAKLNTEEQTNTIVHIASNHLQCTLPKDYMQHVCTWLDEDVNTPEAAAWLSFPFVTRVAHHLYCCFTNLASFGIIPRLVFWNLSDVHAYDDPLCWQRAASPPMHITPYNPEGRAELMPFDCEDGVTEFLEALRSFGYKLADVEYLLAFRAAPPYERRTSSAFLYRVPDDLWVLARTRVSADWCVPIHRAQLKDGNFLEVFPRFNEPAHWELYVTSPTTTPGPLDVDRYENSKTPPTK